MKTDLKFIVLLLAIVACLVAFLSAGIVRSGEPPSDAIIESRLKLGMTVDEVRHALELDIEHSRLTINETADGYWFEFGDNLNRELPVSGRVYTFLFDRKYRLYTALKKHVEYSGKEVFKALSLKPR